MEGAPALLGSIDLSSVACDANCGPTQSFARSLFRDDGLVGFEGPEGTLLKFTGGVDNPSRPTQRVVDLPLVPHYSIPNSEREFTSLLQVPSGESVFQARVVAGLFGPYSSFTKNTSEPSNSSFVILYDNRDSVVISHGVSISGMALKALVPDPAVRARLLGTLLENDDSILQAIQVGARLGGTGFVEKLIDDHSKLEAPPVSIQSRVDLLGEGALANRSASAGPPEGLGYVSDFLEHVESCALIRVIENQGQWDKSLHRWQKHWGWSYDTKGEPSETGPFPDELLPIVAAVTSKLLNLGVITDETVEVLNQGTAARYKPGSGIGPHVDNDKLGPLVVILSMGGACDMVFTRNGIYEGPRATHKVRLEPGSLLFMRDDARWHLSHAIDGATVHEDRWSVMLRSLPHRSES